MTTIAYKDGIIACDSQITTGDVIYTLKKNKIHKGKGKVFVLGGDLVYYEMIIAEYPNFTFTANVCGFVIDNGKLFNISQGDDNLIADPVDLSCSDALGTGARFAIGAMDCGKTAIEAVKIAINRDPFSGGRVRWVKV